VKLVNKIKSLPLKNKRLLGLGIILLLVIALPVFLWAIKNLTFNPNKRAASGEPGVCIAVNKTVTVTPDSDPNGLCHDIQLAVNAVTGDGFTIVIDQGNYNVTQAININGKTNLTIEGNVDGSVDEAWLNFNTTGWGFNITNSSGKLERLHLEGQTPNGLVSVSSSSDFQLGYLKVVALNSHAIDFQSSSNINIYNSEIISSAGALEVQNASNIIIKNNKIHDSENGLALYNSNNLTVEGNIITGNRESAIYANNISASSVIHNTIINNSLRLANPAISLNGNILTLIFSNNLVTSNLSSGISFTGSSFTRTFDHNDVWNNPTGNYLGFENYTGINGNISADPLLTMPNLSDPLNVCLDAGSPAIYNETAFSSYEYMGSARKCGDTATPSPIPTQSPTPLPTSTPIVNNTVNLETAYAKFLATNFYIKTNGKIFTGSPTINIHSDPGSPTYTTLESEWNENGVEMRLFLYFAANNQEWWLTEARIYNGLQPGNWITLISASEAYKTPLGQKYIQNIPGGWLLAHSGSADNADGVHFGSMELQAFVNRVTETPSPAPTSSALPTPIPTVAAILGDVNEDGHVNIVDVGIVVDNYRMSPPNNDRADINSDGIVNIVDIGIIVDHYEF
jgi:parallel beta-helix repeat protein